MEKISEKFDEGEILLTAFNGTWFQHRKHGHQANKCPSRSDVDISEGQKKRTFKKGLKCGKEAI